MSRALFFTIFVVLWMALHALVARRLIAEGTRYSKGIERTIAGTIVLVALLPFIAFFSRRLGIAGGDSGVLSWIGFGALGLSTLLIAFTLVVESTRILAKVGLRLRRARQQGRRQGTSEAPSSPQRRAFFADVVNYGIVGGAVGVAGFGVGEALRVPRVVEVDVPVEGLHPDLEGLRIVQLTDVHVGPTIRGTWLDRVVDVVNELDADVVALTGDFVDGFVEDLAPELAALGRLQAREGAYFVTGNHEYYWDGPAWCRAIAQLGPRPLINEHVVIERGGARLMIAGVADLHADRYAPEHRSDPFAARRGADPVDYAVVLAHQPKSIYAAAEAGFDLQLSGHTHAGQYFPGSLLIHLIQPYVHGLARHEGMHIYVSAGTGYWGPPNRAGSPSEITLLTLRRSSPPARHRSVAS